MKICQTKKELIAYVASMMTKGYFYAHSHTINEGKDLGAIDIKLRDMYYTDMPYSERAKNKRLGVSSHLYARYGRTVVLLATSGSSNVTGRVEFKDTRRSKLLLFGHTIRVLTKDGGKYRAHIEYERKTWERIKARLISRALLPQEELKKLIESELKKAFFLRFKGSVMQLNRLHELILKKRKNAKLKRV